MTILRSGSATDVGRVRAINEDQALEGATLFAVADGMGGHAGGDVAAQTAISALQQGFGSQPSPNGLLQAVRDANQAVWERSQSDPDLRGMGTTLTTIGLVSTGEGDHLVLANVGDSRAYRYRAGRLEQLTVDHSVAEELVARGELTPAQADVHPHRHILTRALGVGPEVDVDIWDVSPRQGDRILLCSDGLTNELSDDEITILLGSVPDPQEAAETLVARANASGGNDNITVVLVDVLVADGEADDGTGAGVAMATDAADRAGSTPPPGVAADPGDGGAEGLAGAAGTVGAAGAAGLTGAIGTAPAGEGSVNDGDGTRGSVATLSSATIPAGLLDGPPPQVDTTPARRLDRKGRPKRPRRITLRVILFVLLLAGVGVAAWSVVRWYANSSYYVGLTYEPSLAGCPPGASGDPRCQEVVIYQGRAGGVLGIQPKIVRHTGVSLAQVPAAALLLVPNVKSNVEEPSLKAADSYVLGLKCQANLVAPVGAPVFPDVVDECAKTSLPPSTSTTTGPGGSTRGPGTTTTTSHALGGRVARVPAQGQVA